MGVVAALIVLIGLAASIYGTREPDKSKTQSFAEEPEKIREEKPYDTPSNAKLAAPTPPEAQDEPNERDEALPDAKLPQNTVVEVPRRTNAYGEPILDDALQKPPVGLAKRLLEGICDAPPEVSPPTIVEPGEVVTCRRCPAFTADAGARANEFRIAKYIRGYFGDHKAERIVAFYRGCEPHSSNFGGRIIYEARATGWQPRQIDEGSGVADACLKVPVSTHRDDLVCTSSYMGFGEYSSSINYYSFAGHKPRRSELIATRFSANSEAEGGSQFYGWRLQSERAGEARLYVGVEEVGERGASRVESFELPVR
ncbi:hypothetical protein [Bradymonas sediminis]|uniref:hypothetical protein n=1 Tax=Bradymonas sediminis TaxID=1548548 RepID=UPI001061D6B0|nr:hypothetical protein [Bradymonas sediminis]